MPGIPPLTTRPAYVEQAIHEKRIEHKEYIAEHGDDLPAISGWRWGQEKGPPAPET